MAPTIFLASRASTMCASWWSKFPRTSEQDKNDLVQNGPNRATKHKQVHFARRSIGKARPKSKPWPSMMKTGWLSLTMKATTIEMNDEEREWLPVSFVVAVQPPGGAEILKPQLSCCQWTLLLSQHRVGGWAGSPRLFFCCFFCGAASAVHAEFELPANSSRRCADRLQSGNQINCSGFIVGEKKTPTQRAFEQNRGEEDSCSLLHVDPVNSLLTFHSCLFRSSLLVH